MTEGAAQKHLQMVRRASAAHTVVFSACSTGLNQIKRPVNVMLALIRDITLWFRSAQRATYGICCTEFNGKQHLLTSHALFMHVTPALNGLQVDVAARWETRGQE